MSGTDRSPFIVGNKCQHRDISHALLRLPRLPARLTAPWYRGWPRLDEKKKSRRTRAPSLTADGGAAVGEIPTVYRNFDLAASWDGPGFSKTENQSQIELGLGRSVSEIDRWIWEFVCEGTLRKFTCFYRVSIKILCLIWITITIGIKNKVRIL